ncbi:Rz1-like lysis system protein LysC [Aeromonas allosaccharophila]|uniref:Rz1-like lysis system protein LysC n=1 Tax=Aeromonas allosaccharophila TaxID=656 RepID=UPI0038CFE138
MSLCLLALCACSSQPTTVVKTQVIKRLPPPGLVPHCPEPEFTGTTYGDAVRFIPIMQTAMRRCQTQINTLNHWIEQEETNQ